MAAEQRDLVRQLAALIERDDGKGAAAGRVPVDREVVGVGLNCSQPTSVKHPSKYQRNATSLAYLDQVGIPGIATNVKVIVAGILSRRLAEDVSYEPIAYG